MPAGSGGVSGAGAPALARGYQPAMIALGGLCAAGAVVTWLFVSNDRAAAPLLAPPAPHHGCALPMANQPLPAAEQEREIRPALGVAR